MTTTTIPTPPGSPEAVAKLCSCPIAANARGEGVNETWLIRNDCPLHGQAPYAGGSFGMYHFTDRAGLVALSEGQS